MLFCKIYQGAISHGKLFSHENYGDDVYNWFVLPFYTSQEDKDCMGFDSAANDRYKEKCITPYCLDLFCSCHQSYFLNKICIGLVSSLLLTPIPSVICSSHWVAVFFLGIAQLPSSQ